MAKKCFLCGLDDSLIYFTDETFKNCSSKLAFRKKKNFKYQEVELTKAALDFVGYHTTCYKKITALQSKYHEDYKNFLTEYSEHVNTSIADEGTECLDSSVHSSKAVTEDEENNTDVTSHTPTDLDEGASTSTASSSNISTCLFCNSVRKNVGKKKQNLTCPQTDQVTQKIKQIAKKTDDSQILSKLENQAIAYHQSCYAFHLTKEKRSTQEQNDSINQKYRNIHKLAFESLKTFIVEEVIDNNKVMYFVQLFRRYQALLLEFGDCEIDFDFIKDYRPKMLQKKIEKIFGDRVTIEASTGPRHQKIIYKTDIDIPIMANNIKLLESKEKHKFEDVAYDLRSCIKNIDSHPLPRRLTADDIIRGECEIPQELFNFIRNLVCGPNFCEENADLTTPKITSICSDIIYAVTKGKCKPAKNLTLGLAMKSLTNSKNLKWSFKNYKHY
ncbi:uncharacterized protein LOC123260042 [Cotesia glomerata]|uniref:uncharacterized protein LOC123260042 n=1 Tax=Cotesia glomerata TaxID=32391 RepID=UPI001D021151|nr:uncharacterized protein LOC123260042 [Cotesia glomerata]